MTAPAPLSVPTRELGAANLHGPGWWWHSPEQTPELQWPACLPIYDRMRRQDSQVKSVLRAITLPIRRTGWRIRTGPARPEVAQHVAGDLGLTLDDQPRPTGATRSRGRFSWAEHLQMSLLDQVWGHMFFEQVYRIEHPGPGGTHLRKLAPRMPGTLAAINVAIDGGLESIDQHPAPGTRPAQLTAGMVRIPVTQLVAYVNDREGGDWLGHSVLRAAYKNWLIKDRLLRVQAQTVERNGMGVPLYKGGPKESDLTAGQKMAADWRSGEAAGAAVPDGADLVLRGVEGTLPNADVAIRYHDEQIARGVLAHFLNLGTQTGSWALGSTFADFFVQSEQALAEAHRHVAQQHVVEDLVDVNWGPDEPAPLLEFDEIGSRHDATAQAIKMLLDSGALRPDRSLEEALRTAYGLPPKDTPPPGDGPAIPTTEDGGQAP